MSGIDFDDQSTLASRLETNSKVNEVKRKIDDVLPKEFDEQLAMTIFEVGLKVSSPKLLLSLMPEYPGLNTEHIKSHLQKYRIHSNRSKEEFTSYFNEVIDTNFKTWMKNDGYKNPTKPMNLVLNTSAGLNHLYETESPNSITPAANTKSFSSSSKSNQEVENKKIKTKENQVLIDNLLNYIHKWEELHGDILKSIDNHENPAISSGNEIK